MTEWFRTLFRNPRSKPVVESNQSQLTDFGQEIAKKLNLHKLAAKSAQFLFHGKSVGFLNHNELYDNYIKEKLDKNIKKEICKSANKFGIGKKEVCLVFRILLEEKFQNLMYKREGEKGEVQEWGKDL